jgi:preprotein translocase subunit SecG
MASVVITIHVLISIALVIIILLQHGKGADVGAVFGGSSQTVFGAGGAGNALTKATVLLATIFFVTSLFLAYASTRRVTGSIFSGPFSGSRSVMPAAPVSKVPAPAGKPAGGATPAPANH